MTERARAYPFLIRSFLIEKICLPQTEARIFAVITKARIRRDGYCSIAGEPYVRKDRSLPAAGRARSNADPHSDIHLLLEYLLQALLRITPYRLGKILYLPGEASPAISSPLVDARCRA